MFLRLISDLYLTNIRHISDMSQMYLKHISSTSQTYFRLIKNITQIYLTHISDISQTYRVTQKKLYLFCGSQGEHGCFQNSEINIFLDYQWQIWLFPTNTFIDFLVRKMIFVIAQNLAQLSNYKYLFLKLFWDTQ